MSLSASGSASAGAGAGASDSGRASTSKGGASASGSASAGAGAGGSSSSRGSVGRSGGASASGSASAGAGAGSNSSGSTSSGNSMGGGNGGNRGGIGGANSPAGMNNSSLGGGGSGLNSAGNRASGAGPGASSNRSTTGGGFGTGSSVGQVGAGLNSAGNRASGAGPGASANRTTTGSGFGSSPGSTFGGQNSPSGMKNSQLSGGMASFTVSQDKTRQGDLAQQARASETQSMKDLAREQALGTISTAEVGKKDPYNTLSGGLTTDITNMSVKDAIALSKTQWNGKLANVIGAYQTKDTTLLGIATKMGLLDAKMTPAVQDQLAVGLLQERANLATVKGQIDVNKFAKEISKEWASVADPTTGVSHYAKNGIDKASISAAAALAMAKDLVANGVVSPNKSVSSITSKDVSQVQTKAPGIDRFNSTYLGSKAPASQKTASTSQQNDPGGLPAGTYPGHVVGDGIAPAFGTPAKQATATPAPAAPVSAPAPAPAPPRTRSLAEKVAAGAIDAGLGMMPGVGTAISVVNGGLALTGNKTLGERIAGSIATGEGAGAGPDSGADRLGGGNNRDHVVKDKSTVPPPEENFEDRYIKYVDPTPRPSPAQKWDYNTPGYA